MAEPSPLHSLLAWVNPPRPSLSSVHQRVGELRKAVRFWTGEKAGSLSWPQCQEKLEAAWKDPNASSRVLGALDATEREVLGLYRRYGNFIDGALLRAELLLRGLAQIVTSEKSFPRSRWQRDRITPLTEKLVLVPAEGTTTSWHSYSYTVDAAQRFRSLVLPPALATRIEPAGLPPSCLTPRDQPVTAQGAPPLVDLTLELSRLFAFLAGRGGIALTKNENLTVPSLRTLTRAVPLAEDADFPLPDRLGLLFEVLRGVGAVVSKPEQATVDPAVATRFFTATATAQAHAAARAWLFTPRWIDGEGLLRGASLQDHRAAEAIRAREVLVSVLSGLATAGDAWFSLADLVSQLFSLYGVSGGYSPTWYRVAWEPPVLDTDHSGTDATLGWGWRQWVEYNARGLANALMVTLPSLGLVERGRFGRGKANAFRLTPLGRSVFGAPEILPHPEQDERPFLVIQPNFDVLAYLNETDARAAGFLGRLAESAARTGSVQSFRLTRDSIYQALESGLSHEDIVDFLKRHNRGAVPANVLQTLAEWGARRESMIVRAGVTLVAFPDQAARDAWLASSKGSACGDRFALAAGKLATLKEAIRVDHASRLRRVLTVDEEGKITAGQPLDLVLKARLRRLAEPTVDAWRLTADSIAGAVAAGLKSGAIERWLEQMLAEPMPPLLGFALRGWQGKGETLELGDVLMLRVRDPVLFSVLVASPRVRPFLAGVLGQGRVAVHRDRRRELASLLASLGISLAPPTTPGT